ncbi:heat shock protein 70 [Tribonema minus]|uniref:Heat shock protein 70 n=1 Tax=Tribonema minus TaxID=303371 RepID=A0A836CK58_9STRA|nr:heat shock protein 70 [Tribonema minus]
MSSVGIDLGNDSCVIGLAGRGGIDIILNESSNRRTPSMVSFQGKQRFMGEAALSISRSNFKNTARDLKRMVGRRWEEPELQADLARVPFSTEKHPETGGVGVRVTYNEESVLFSVEQVVAMMLNKAADIAKAANSDLSVAEAVISIPGWYTDAMRHAMLNAVQIAGLNCLRLMHESTATALAYGIYRSAKGEFSDGNARKVLFLDLGHSSFCASVVTFTQAALSVKSTCYDRNLGGRDMDWAIAQHLADDFKAKTKMDPRDSHKSMIKLLDAAERAKKTLSPIGVADTIVNIECLVEERDYNGRLTLEAFEKLIAPLVARLDAPVLQALKEAGVTVDQLDAIEIVGGATRVPLVKRHLAGLLRTDPAAINYGLSCTMNADEAVARGCALQCAILSSRFRVKDFAIVEAVPYPVRMVWDPAPSDDSDGEEAEESGNSTMVFHRNGDSPRTRRFTLKRNQPFTLKAVYDDPSLLPPGAPLEIATYRIDIPQQFKGVSPPCSVRINVRHDLNGIIQLQSAQLMEEVAEAPPAAADASAAAAAPPAAAMEVEGKEGEAKGEGKEGETAEAAAAAPASPVPAEPAKKKFKPVTLAVDAATAAWKINQVNAAVEAEASMANQDRVVKETSNKRNELEAYIYSMRDRIGSGGDLAPFTAPAEAASMSTALEQAEEWLYSDEGFDSTKSVYAGKLKDLQALGGPLEARLYESQNRDAATAELRLAADVYKRFANSQDETTAHVSDDDKDKVRANARKAEEWLFDMQAKQGALPATQDPCLRVADVKAQVEELHKTCKPIMTQPKPAPKPKEEEKKEEEKKEQAPPTEAAPTSGEPMDVNEAKEGAEGVAPMEEDKAEGGAEPMEVAADEAK